MKLVSVHCTLVEILYYSSLITDDLPDYEMSVPFILDIMCYKLSQAVHTFIPCLLNMWEQD